jgi:UDP-GlcNAc:undecaprenyl-phosphate/decaprenyl-phosphate GlcNAc-1-phosphate transferase
MAIAVAALVLAFLLSYLATPLVRQLALRVGFVDRPDAHRKTQSTAVSLGGGLSLLIATPIAVLVLLNWWGYDLWLSTRMPTSLLGLALGSALLACVGVVDDGHGMRGSTKLFFQLIAAILVMGSGFSVPRIAILNMELELGWLGSLFTVLWLLGAINSLNLIDGVDGLAGSVGVVFCLTFGCMALLGLQYLDAIIAFALAGALLGFLRYNFPPATIYLGDTGSMLIGFVLGTIALRCSMKQAATLAFATPLAIWSIPIFDSVAAVVRRKLTGRSIYATDRGHIHHVLLMKGWNVSQAVGLIVLLCSLTSIGAIASIYYENEWLGIGVTLGVLAILIFTRMFGYVEMVLLNTRLFGFGRHISPSSTGKDKIRHTSMALQGNLKWEEWWGTLVESAERFQLVKMRLNLSLPRLHEDFYATWSKAGNHRRENLWQADIPLVVNGLHVGRLFASGVQDEALASREIAQFMQFVETLESQLGTVIQEGLRASGRKGLDSMISKPEPVEAPTPESSSAPEVATPT